MSVKGYQIDASVVDLNDVTTGSPPLSNNDALIYNSTSGQWENKPTTISQGLDNLIDVTITPVGSPPDVLEKDVLAYDAGSGQWTNQTATAAGLMTIDVNGLSTIQVDKSSSGLFTGGLLQKGTLTGSPPTTTLVTVTAGSGIIVNNYTDPENPSYVLVSWSQFTDVAVTSITTAHHTYFAINSAGALIQSTSPFTTAEHRDIVIVGKAGHPNRVSVAATRSDPHAAFDASHRLADLADSIGAFNVSGNIYGPNGANLNIDKSPGTSYSIGANFHTDKASPDITTDPLGSALTFVYSYRDGSGGYIYDTPTTIIDPNNYDNDLGGSPPALAAVAVNDWSVQIIRYFPGPNQHRIEYAQTTYGTKAAAIADIPDVNHEYNPSFSESVVRGYLIVGEAATDLSLTAQAEFIEAGKFGVAGGGSGSAGIFTSAFESAELGIAASTEYSAAHGLGVRPNGMQAFLRCTTAELGYSIGDEADFSNAAAGSPATSSYGGLYADATNIYWYTGPSLVIVNRNNGAAVNPTLANWKIILRAYA